MSTNNEAWIAGGVIAAGLAYYLLVDEAKAAPPPRPAPVPPLPPPVVTPGLPGPAAPGGYVSKLCPNVEADLPDENKADLDAMLAEKQSSAFYGDAAQQYMAAGWPNAAACLAAAQLAAAAKEGLISPKIPGGSALPQTKTCAFWLSQYQNEVAKLNAGIALLGTDPVAANVKIESATAGINHTKAQLAQLGCPVP